MDVSGSKIPVLWHLFTPKEPSEHPKKNVHSIESLNTSQLRWPITMVVILESELCSSRLNFGDRQMSHALTNLSDDAVKNISNRGLNASALTLSEWP